MPHLERWVRVIGLGLGLHAVHRDDAGTQADGADGEEEGDVAGGLVPHLRRLALGS